MSKTSPSIDFESQLVELEKIVQELEGEIKLEKALELFERGMSLSLECQKFLTVAEQKVELLKRTAEGVLNVSAFLDDTEEA